MAKIKNPLTVINGGAEDYPNGMKITFVLTSATFNFNQSFSQTMKNGVVFNWGDGSSPSTYGTIDFVAQHTYSGNVGDEITLNIDVNDGVLICGNNFFWGGSVKKLILGRKCTFARSGDFRDCGTIDEVECYCFENPPSFYGTTIKKLTVLASQPFEGGRTVSEELIIIANCDSLQSNTLLDWIVPSPLILPEGLIYVNTSCGNGINVEKIVFPKSLRYMRQFNNATIPLEWWFMSDRPPTAYDFMSGLNANAIIFVPFDSYNSYATATNWTVKASYMRGFGDYITGKTLPTTTTDGLYTLTWYASIVDLRAGTNPVTTAESAGNYYCSYTEVTA